VTFPPTIWCADPLVSPAKMQLLVLVASPMTRKVLLTTNREVSAVDSMLAASDPEALVL